MKLARAIVPSLLFVAGASCGARTGLPVPEGDAAIDAPPDVATDRKVAQRLRQSRVGSVDLLLVVDNSISMADKQSELGRRIPQLVKTLTNPDVDPATGKPSTPPVADLHVAVITSSLGSFGTSSCRPRSGRTLDDRGRLLPRAGEGGGTGFHVDKDGGVPIESPCPPPVPASPVTWVYDGSRDPSARFKGTGESRSAQTAVSCIVKSAGDDGCGYEMTLEAMYRFLMDPSPFAEAAASCRAIPGGDDCGTSNIVQSGEDMELLKQRAAFLRPDSLLAIVVLSDEDDASLKPVGTNWLPLAKPPGSMPRAFTACAKVPDDFEPDDVPGSLFKDYGCRSCFDSTADAACSRPWPFSPTLSEPDADVRNLRAFRHVQRFGRSFLWSRRRYVDGLTKALLPDRNGAMVPNPIFAGGVRTPELLVFASIVGVPKALVTDPSGKLKTLGEADWEKLVSSDPSKRDVHMIESIAPRPGLALYTGDWTIDPVHGGERPIGDGTDLQYACIAPRATREATPTCTAPGAWRTNPICDRDGSQPRYRAYPALRHLRVVHDVNLATASSPGGPIGLVASICDQSYQPAIAGITERVQRVVSGQCLMSTFPRKTDGSIECQIYEAFDAATVDGKARCEDVAAGYCTPGAAPCRLPSLSPFAATRDVLLPIVVRTEAGAKVEEVAPSIAGGNVYAVGSDGKRRLVCEMLQLAAPRVTAEEALACLDDPGFSLPPGRGGFCYARATPLVGEQCVRAGSKGKMRFVGDLAPRATSEIFTFCK